MNQHTSPDLQGEFTTHARFSIKEITTEVIWTANDGIHPLGVVALLNDSATGNEIKMFISEQQLRQGAGRNTGAARRQVEAALEAIDREKLVYSQSRFDGPLSVLAGGPSH